jgi:glycosyltransferase 2 family protein
VIGQRQSSYEWARLNCAFAAKIVVAAAIIAALIHYNTLSLGALGNVIVHPALASIAVVLLVMSLAVGSQRWRLLLRGQVIPVTFRTAFEITFVGQFLNIFLPGGIGGDAARFYYVRKHVDGKLPAAAASLAVDRLLGFGGLAIVALVAIAMRWAKLSHTPLLARFALAFFFTFAAVLAALAVFAFVIQRSDMLRRFGQGRVVVFLGQIVEAFRLYAGQPATLAVGVGLSIFIHVTTIATFLIIAAMFAYPGIGWLDYAVAVPLSVVANQIPATPGGIGIGEGAFDVICRLLAGAGAAPYATIFLADRCLGALVSLYGAWVWASYR